MGFWGLAPGKPSRARSPPAGTTTAQPEAPAGVRGETGRIVPPARQCRSRGRPRGCRPTAPARVTGRRYGQGRGTGWCSLARDLADEGFYAAGYGQDDTPADAVPAHACPAGSCTKPGICFAAD